MNFYLDLTFIINDMVIITNKIKIVNKFGNEFHWVGKIY